MSVVHASHRSQFPTIFLKSLLQMTVDADSIFEFSQQLVAILLKRGSVFFNSAVFSCHADELRVHSGWMHRRIAEH